jgi:Glycosyl hydrolases family 16
MRYASRLSPLLILFAAVAVSAGVLFSCKGENDPSNREQSAGGNAGTAQGGSSGDGGSRASGGVSAAAGTTQTGDTGGMSNCGPEEIGKPPNCFDAPPVTPASGKQWNVTFSEEFNGSDYDHGKLSPCFDWNYGDCTNSFNKGREHYDPAQVQVSDGTGKLIAAPLNPPQSSSGCYQNQCTYKSGLLSTCRPNAGDNSDYLYTFTYGYVEARMKFPGTRGFFTAFWMLPANPSYDYRSEIDIVEILGDDPESIFMTYHYNDRTESHAVNSSTKDNGACAVKDYSTDFHKFGLDWQADHVAWYIDGVKCDEFWGTATEIENGPMQIILDLMVDHDWQQRWGVTLQDPTLVRQIEVDYLRVYQQK